MTCHLLLLYACHTLYMEEGRYTETTVTVSHSRYLVIPKHIDICQNEQSKQENHCPEISHTESVENYENT